MADFVNKKTVVTKKPQITVEPGLKPGKYRFEMVPITTEGRELQAHRITVEIVDRDRLRDDILRNDWRLWEGRDFLRDLTRGIERLANAVAWVKKNGLRLGRC